MFGWRRGLVEFLFALVLLTAATIGRASADAQTIATTPAPVIFAQLPAGSLTVRTWDRAAVSIDADPTIFVHHIGHVPANLPPMFTFFAQDIDTPDGPLALPPEPFLVQPFDPSGHDAVGLTGTGNVTIIIPNGSPLLVTRVGAGEITIDGYHGGTFVSQIRMGLLRLNDVSGTGGFQINNGPAIVTNSTFERLRARTGRGNMFFENCTARQIEVTSLTGSILYDNGGFEPGLARFESQRGSIALGIGRGGAHIDAHSPNGRVISEGSVRPGPFVTATTGRGSVYFYTGSIRSHPNLQRQIPMRPEHGIPGHRRRPPGGFPRG